MTNPAPTTAAELLRNIAREWRVMVKDPRFALYNGVDSPERKLAYTMRRLQEVRTALTPYLHRPECEAFAEDIENARAKLADDAA